MMKHWTRTIGVVVAMLLAGCASTGQVAATAEVRQPAAEAVQVYAAGSLRDALTQIADAYQARTGVPVALTFGAPQVLRERIENGGAAQVFASAGMALPRQLAARGGWQEPVGFARSAMCALTSDQVDAAPATLLGLMLLPGVRVGVSTAGADPAGDDAWALFRKADVIQPGAYAALDAKVLKLMDGAGSPEPPPGQSAAAWIMQQGQADVYLTDCAHAMGAQKEVPRLKVVQFPPVLQVGALYGVSVRTAAAQPAYRFEQALLAPPAQAVFRRYGFAAPDGEPATQR